MPDDHAAGLFALMTQLYRASRPDGRVADHLLVCDMNELQGFVRRNPDAMTEGEVAHA